MIMETPEKNNDDCFPEWNPTRKVVYILEESINRRKAYLSLKYSSSGFVTKSVVRNYIFNRDGHKCLLCGKKTNLSIDHINSVLSAFDGRSDINKLNTKGNLQTLCRSCNSAKLP